jgi:hypothetical protein
METNRELIAIMETNRKLMRDAALQRKAEFKLFKKIVREQLGPEMFRQISDEYNRQVTKLRGNKE